MASEGPAAAAAAAAAARCACCGRALPPGRAFLLGGVRRCWRCALRHRPLLRRSTLTAIVVGTVLVLINQGPELLAGAVAPALVWKVPLTYTVPFCVSTWGALGAAREAPSEDRTRR